ncbi:ATP-binding cassette domain-containing protein [Nocardioidaceae bacterium SCSIO 66511]|nr:ATP-binding cassette domain-containing protein [Nocardioidaceae bacterium SCSIO 66511]
MNTTMIETHGLTRHFVSGKQTVEAVRGLDLAVESGELVALLGPNGAGKSTTLRMLTTLIAPTSGTAMVAGHDVTGDPKHVRRRIGFIGQGNGAGHQQHGRDELVTQGRAYGLSRRTARTRAAELIESLDLAGVADRKVSTMSGGQRRRLDIAMGLIHAPELLFLDEPSTGLDPQNRANLQEHIVSLRERFGTTVVLTTHYLDEADALAERIVVVDHGRIVADDTAERLKADLGGDRIALGFDSHDAAALAATRVATAIPAAAVARTGSGVEVRAESGPELLPRLIGDLSTAGITVRSADVTRPTLDDVFLGLTGRSLREGHSANDESTTSATVGTDREEIAA